MKSIEPYRKWKIDMFSFTFLAMFPGYRLKLVNTLKWCQIKSTYLCRLLHWCPPHGIISLPDNRGDLGMHKDGSCEWGSVTSFMLHAFCLTHTVNDSKEDLKTSNQRSTHADLPSTSSFEGQRPFLTSSIPTFSGSFCSTACSSLSSILLQSWLLKHTGTNKPHFSLRLLNSYAV